MYVFIFPDETIELRDTWDIEYKPPVGTYVYEPSDTALPWTVQRDNGPVSVPKYALPPFCKTVELIYPRAQSPSPMPDIKKSAYYKSLIKLMNGE